MNVLWSFLLAVTAIILPHPTDLEPVPTKPTFVDCSRPCGVYTDARGRSIVFFQSPYPIKVWSKGSRP